jgi:hypothetical protein
MRTRKVYLLKDEAFVAAQTKLINIGVVDPISWIDIIVEMTNGAAMTEASEVKPHDEFTKIELVDGADVIASGSMEEWQALNSFEMGALPRMELTLDDGAVQREACHIHFGLSRNDPAHYLQPDKFANLQMKITNTFTAAAATSWAAAGHTITVIANVIEEGAAYCDGFLTAKSMYAFTAVDGAVETIDMPRDYPYRGILLQAFKTAYRPDENLEHVKLTADADKYIPIDVDMDHIIQDNIIQFGEMRQKTAKRMTNAGDIMYSDLFYDTMSSIVSATTLIVPHITSVDCDQVVAETLGQT